MRRIIAVLSMVMVAGAAGCGAGGPRDDVSGRGGANTSAIEDPVASRGGEGDATVGQSKPELRHKSKRSRAGPARSAPVDVAMVESRVAARMPRHDQALHRQLAAVIHRESRHAGVDPLLVLALIHVESSFDPDAVSPAGALGLMQLRERTMRREIERAGLEPADPLDPVANVRAGIQYLRRLLRAFGNTDVALMAYNAGPNRILSHRRAGEIPERFYLYPRRVRGELERLRAPSASRSTRGVPAPAVAAAVPAAARASKRMN
jgi:soluble lytic murein transglycosylase-like protein